MKQQQEQVLRSVAQEDIRLIRLWFTDVAGVLKSVSIDPGELEEAFSEGIGFDGSSIEGLTRVYESDMLLRPDAATFQRLHTKDGTDVHGRMFCDVLTPDGLPSPADPRGALERAVQRASEMGFSVFAHPEIEFYLLRQPVDINHLEPVDQAGYFDHVTRGLSNDFRRKIVRALEETGIQVEFSHHEGGPGQNEVDLRAVDALHAADNIMTARTLIEEVALAEGMLATFMPKPFINRPGSGMHTHLSLFEGDENAFYDPSGRYQLSEIGRYFIAGLLHHAREIAAITNQHVNSYKRLWGGEKRPPIFVGVTIIVRRLFAFPYISLRRGAAHESNTGDLILQQIPISHSLCLLALVLTVSKRKCLSLKKQKIMCGNSAKQSVRF